ncbi:MAG TPA: questin oxidase family protein, partial [Burkholderiaceae bacterium]
MNTAVLDSPAAAVADRRAVLHRLLDEALAYGPEHGAGMASHLPMALAALDGLGAHEAQMRSFFAHYARRLRRVELPKGGAQPVDDWKRLRGRIDQHETLRASFARAIARDGADAVLRDAVPGLVDGVAGAAFHGPIRAAHAVEAGHDGELAAGLAYWAARWEPLPAPGAATLRIAGASAWLDAIDARRITFDPDWRASASLISARMQQAAVTPPYIELGGALAVEDVAPDALLLDLAKACAARYAATGNFTVLHMATASRALRVLGRWLPVNPVALAPLLHAVAAAELAARAVPLPRDASG